MLGSEYTSVGLSFHNRRLLEIDKQYSFELCFSIEKQPEQSIGDMHVTDWPPVRYDAV